MAGWKRLTGAEIDNLEVTLRYDVSKLESHIEPSFIIGGDSHYSKKHTLFIVVLVIDTNGNGASGYYKEIHVNKEMTMKERLFIEAYHAVEQAMVIEPILNDMDHMIDCIHLDLNPNAKFKSNEAVTSAVGYVKSMAFDCKIKPDAVVGSIVADKWTK